MAVDGDDVASFDYDGDSVRAIQGLEPRLQKAADRFVEKCLSGLRAEKGRSFKGAIVLSPEAVGEFLLSNLVASMGADAVRKGRSRLAGKVGHKIAADAFTLVDDGTLAGGVASSAFDREGMPVKRQVLLDAGLLTTFLYNHFEARAAGLPCSTGHASGSASSLPAIGAHRLEVGAGNTAIGDLCAGAGPIVWVGRFSGSSNPVTGEFSGVVKNGFLWENGSKRPVRETLIAGNLFEALQRIEAVSRERQEIEGTRLLPAIRIEGVSVTAG
jgi:PmbA protein